MKSYSDAEIDLLIQCPKVVSVSPKHIDSLDKGHYRNNMELRSVDGQYSFSVFMRRHEFFAENFSIGLKYHPFDTPGSFVIVRLNGPHGEHIDGWDDFDTPHCGYHIHKAKNENLEKGRRAEIYAELTTEYSNYNDALLYLLRYCNIRTNHEYFTKLRQGSLF